MKVLRNRDIQFPYVILFEPGNPRKFTEKALKELYGKIGEKLAPFCNHTDSCKNYKNKACSTCKRMYHFCTTDWYKE